MPEGDSALEALALLFPGPQAPEPTRSLAMLSYEEAAPSSRSAAWLLGGQRSLAVDSLAEPSRLWGLSARFAPIRDYERVSRLAFFISCVAHISAPSLFWAPRSAPRAPFRIRAGLWVLFLAGNPLSLVLSAILGPAIAASWPESWPGSSWAWLPICLLLPTFLGAFERRVLFARWPRSNPARWLVAYWLPGSSELAKITRDARRLYAELSGSGAASMLPEEALFKPRFDPAADEPERDARRKARALSMRALEQLRERLAAQGTDPGMDAETAARSAIERRELDEGLSQAPPPDKGRSRAL